jgi:O-antigen ligase
VPRSTGSSRSGLRPADLDLRRWLGPTLAIALAGWPLIAHGISAATVGFACAVLVALVAWTLGGRLAQVDPMAVGKVTAALVAAAILPLVLTGTLDSVIGPPLGYANANAALLSAAVAGLAVVWQHMEWPQQRWVLATAIVFTFAALFTKSISAGVSCLLLLAVGLTLSRGRTIWWQAGGAALLVVGFTATVAAGMLHRRESLPSIVERALAANRPALWSEALAQAQEQPVAGVGVGRFREFSSTAADPDVAWAHSAPLQILAETGLVGLVLLAALTAWLVWRLGRASALLAVLALQPMVDYVLHFPAVLVAFSFVLGGAAVSSLTRGQRPGRQTKLETPGST